MANLIYRGGPDFQPETINLPVAGAYLPGVLVLSDGAQITVAGATDGGKKTYVLSNKDFHDQTVADAYASGDTGVAYDALPGQKYQIRLAGATYAKGDLLKVAANGYLTAASSAGDIVFAYFDGPAGAITAGALADVTIAAGFTVA